MKMAAAPTQRSLSAPELISVLRSSLETQSDVMFAYVFGSVAKGRMHSGSDVDVAVWLETEDIVQTVDRALDLEAELERKLMRPVDVVILNGAPLDLCHNVLRHGRLFLSRDDAARVRFFVEHASRYYDMEHARALFGRYMVRRIREGTFGGGTGHSSKAP